MRALLATLFAGNRRVPARYEWRWWKFSRRPSIQNFNFVTPKRINFRAIARKSIKRQFHLSNFELQKDDCIETATLAHVLQRSVAILEIHLFLSFPHRSPQVAPTFFDCFSGPTLTRVVTEFSCC